MQDKELSEIIGIPHTSIQNWKKSKNYRRIIYEILKNMDKEELKKKSEAIKLLYGIKE